MFAFTDAPGPWHMFNLPSLASLRTFGIHVWTSGAHITGDLFTYNGQWCLCSVAPMLSLLRPTLHHIYITLSISGYPLELRAHLQKIDWAGLQCQLDRFPNLKSVFMQVRPRRRSHVLYESLHVVSSMAEDRLAPLIARGILEIDISPELDIPPRPSDQY